MADILVTGAAGFIGYHLSWRLLERGDSVAALDNLNGYYDVNLKEARLKEPALPMTWPRGCGGRARVCASAP